MRAGDTKADGGDAMVEIVRTANISCANRPSCVFSHELARPPLKEERELCGLFPIAQPRSTIRMVQAMPCTILMVLGAAAWAQGAAAFAPQAGPFFAGAPPSRASAHLRGSPIARNARAPAFGRTTLPLAIRPARMQAKKILMSTPYSAVCSKHNRALTFSEFSSLQPLVLAAADGQGGGGGEEEAGRCLYRRDGVELREAEEHFVDEEENLEAGEKLLRAIKAFDERGVMLCAGALVRTSIGENYPGDTWDRSLQTLVADQNENGGGGGGGGGGASGGGGGGKEAQIYHDLWLGDSVEQGVGPNVQIKGALAVLDTLFLHHLRIARSGERFRVHADGDLASACRTAAQARAFPP